MDKTTKSRRWSNNNERMCKLWKSIFQDKIKIFNDQWSVSCVSQLPEPEEWEEPLVEFLKITFKCKECAHVWSARQGLAHLFFRRNQPRVPTPKPNGEVLIWLQYQHCPSCSSTMIPLMDVKPQEIDAVLGYLKIKIAWFYYKIPFTADEKNKIEEIRKMSHKMKMLMRVKENESACVESSIQNTKTISDGSVLAQQNKNEKSIEGKGPRSTSATSGSSVIKTGTVKSNKKPIPASGSSAKPLPSPQQGARIQKKTRWNKTPEQIRNEWGLAFHEIFKRSVTKNEPYDEWTFELDKVTKKHPLRAQKLWHRFLGERVEAGFRCSECNYVWQSRKGWVAFWIRQNDLGSDGKLQGGHVTIHILGQKCEKCIGRVDSYQLGDLQGDEIDRVLRVLYMEIDYWLYENPDYDEEDENKLEIKRRPWRPLGTTFLHKKSFCQACSNKVCSKSFKAKCRKPQEVTDPVLEESNLVLIPKENPKNKK